MEGTPVDRLRQWATGATADLVLRFLVVLSLVFGIYMYTGYRDLSHCVARYNDQQAANSAELRRTAESERQALDNYLFAVDALRSLPPAEARAKATQAFENFVKTRKEANETREKNPPPPPPSESCDV